MKNMTKSMARNIYFGGSAFFFLVLVGLSYHTVKEMPKRDHRENITDQVKHGKELWEKNNCVGCHTIMGEGAYYAPELANAFDRLGGGNEEGFKAFMQGWMKAQPLPALGRRKMPQFNLTKEEVDALSEFLIWTSRIDDNGWPPNIKG